MRRWLCALAGVLVAVQAAPPPAAQSQTDAVAFVDVSVLPMDREAVLEHQTVVVRGNRIAQMGPSASVAAPAGAVHVDGAGKYLMPALAEMHAHIPGGKATDADMARVLIMYVANGIGTIRGMLGDPRHLPLRDRANRGEIVSPTIYTSGPSLNGNSVPTKDAAVQMVTEQQKAGYDFLKIHPGIRLDVFEALAATADKVGLGFAGHVPADVGLVRVLELKQATIDHLDGYVEALAREGAPPSQFFGVNLMDHVDPSRIPELVAKTRAAGTWMVPTEVLFESGVSEEDPAAMVQWPEMKYVPPAQRMQWIENKKKMMASVPSAARARFIALRRRLIKALHDGGVGFLLGSDAPQVWNVPGFSIHRELQALVAAGLTPYQALESGTRNVAAFYKTLDGRGTVAAGKRADLLLLDANPLADIANSTRIAGVMVGGRWLAREDLQKRLDAHVVSP